MKLSEITPLILTFNEAPNIQATLSSFSWAQQIVLVDSFSTDNTLAIVGVSPKVKVIQRKFDNHTAQWNFGLKQIQTEWVLALDADYVGTDGFRQELTKLNPQLDVYFSKFKYCVFGKPLRSSLYPPRAVLFKARQFQYTEDGHTQLLDLAGQHAGTLASPLNHDDRKSLSHWSASQVKYARLEAEKLISAVHGELGWKDRIRKRIVLAPVLTLFYCLFGKRLVLDGKAGLFYTGQRIFAELLLSLMLLDNKLRNDHSD